MSFPQAVSGNPLDSCLRRNDITELEMGKFSLLQALIGLLFLILGLVLTFSQRLNYQKEELKDFIAVIGLLLMVTGVIILASPLLR